MTKIISFICHEMSVFITYTDFRLQPSSANTNSWSGLRTPAMKVGLKNGSVVQETAPVDTHSGHRANPVPLPCTNDGARGEDSGDEPENRVSDDRRVDSDEGSDHR